MTCLRNVGKSLSSVRIWDMYKMGFTKLDDDGELAGLLSHVDRHSECFLGLRYGKGGRTEGVLGPSGSQALS